MRFRFVLSAMIVLGVGLTACAHPSASASDEASRLTRVIPPRIRSAGPLRFRAPASGLNVQIEVPISEDGIADASGMHAMGRMPADTRSDIEQWLLQTTFVPATQGGVPIRGIFKMNLRTR